MHSHTYRTAGGLPVEITHPLATDLPWLLELYRTADLDTRNLLPVSQEAYPSVGTDAVHRQWRELVPPASTPPGWLRDCLVQAEALLRYASIPPAGQLIRDPFAMKEAERSSTVTARQLAELSNILVARINGEPVASGRVLQVGDSWEIVSIVTVPAYRRQGLARLVISELLRRYTQRPLYSFQPPHLVPFYLQAYAQANPNIQPFHQLPERLRHDLFHMNIFWGPNVIITLPER